MNDGIVFVGEKLDWTFDWSEVLSPEDTISASVWNVGTLTSEAESNTDDMTTIWLTDFTVGTHVVTNRITTIGGRVFDQSIRLHCAE